MRAARLHELGGSPRVDDVPEPAGSPLLAVTASALNPVDVAIGTGRFYGGTPELPYVIGSEAIGTLPDGRRVWVRDRGVMAERVVVSEDACCELPEGVDDATALACGVAGVTGWLAVSWRARVTEADTVLVLGASGSVGAAAVQGAKVLGARRVIGAARRTDHVPAAADEAIPVDGELPQADVIVDGLWGDPAARALAASAPGVRFVHLGQSAGPEATLQSAWVRGKVANILGHSLFSIPADVLADGYRELCVHARDGRIVFETEAYPLDRVAEAWERQASGSPGAKVVITFS
jgi:NADPH:quinone reductase-like Zn-dependent oxidoreductase